VKNPESPRAYPAPPAGSLPAEGREERLVPRYVQAPALREHGRGPRNLFWGVAMLLVALILLVAAILLGGAKAMLSVVTCLLTFTALFVLARLHIFRQRNGGFLALAMVCLIGAGAPLADKAFSWAQGWVGSHRGADGPVVTLHSDETAVPLLTQSFALSKPAGDGKQVKVLRDSRVMIADKPFLIKAGERFALIEAKGNQTTFAVRDLHVSLPADVTEVVDPAAVAKGVESASTNAVASAAAAKAPEKSTSPDDAELAEITRNAQQEAMRRYPALSVKDSLENGLFVSTYKQLRESPNSTNFFANPEWPIELAELLAQREGWMRGSGPSTTGPAPVLDAPVDAPRAGKSPTNLPPVDLLDAGSDLPRAGRSGR
jgi:hypothetical protein